MFFCIEIAGGIHFLLAPASPFEIVKALHLYIWMSSVHCFLVLNRDVFYLTGLFWYFGIFLLLHVLLSEICENMI